MAPTDGLYEQFGRNFRTARERRGLTQTDVAKRIGVTRGSISNIEAGRQRFPFHVAFELAKVVDVDVTALLVDNKVGEQERPVPKLPPQFRGLDEDEKGWAVRVLTRGAEGRARR